MYTNIESSIIHKSQKMKTIQTSTAEWIKCGLSIRWKIIQPQKGTQYDTCTTRKNLENLTVSERSQRRRLRLARFHSYEMSGTGKSQRTSIGSRGAQGIPGVLKASEVSFQGDENVLELDRGDDRTSS